jgi:hypothetical protein
MSRASTLWRVSRVRIPASPYQGDVAERSKANVSKTFNNSNLSVIKIRARCCAVLALMCCFHAAISKKEKRRPLRPSPQSLCVDPAPSGALRFAEEADTSRSLLCQPISPASPATFLVTGNFLLFALVLFVNLLALCFSTDHKNPRSCRLKRQSRSSGKPSLSSPIRGQGGSAPLWSVASHPTKTIQPRKSHPTKNEPTHKTRRLGAPRLQKPAAHTRLTIGSMRPAYRLRKDAARIVAVCFGGARTKVFPRRKCLCWWEGRAMWAGVVPSEQGKTV